MVSSAFAPRGQALRIALRTLGRFTRRRGLAFGPTFGTKAARRIFRWIGAVAVFRQWPGDCRMKGSAVRGKALHDLTHPPGQRRFDRSPPWSRAPEMSRPLQASRACAVRCRLSFGGWRSWATAGPWGDSLLGIIDVSFGVLTRESLPTAHCGSISMLENDLGLGRVQTLTLFWNV